MEKNTIQNSFNEGTFGDNLNVQGKNVRQQVVTDSSNNEIGALFDRLISEIKALSPKDEVEDAIDNAKK